MDFCSVVHMHCHSIQYTGIRFALITSCFSTKKMHTGPLATSWMLGFQLKGLKVAAGWLLVVKEMPWLIEIPTSSKENVQRAHRSQFAVHTVAAYVQIFMCTKKSFADYDCTAKKQKLVT